MTGFYISAGYSSEHQQEEVIETMFKVGREIAQDPQGIVNEMQFNGSVPWREMDGTALMVYAELFKKQEDKTIEFESERPEWISEKYDWEPRIKMLASGGGSERVLKEESRRAFIRLLVNHMHRMGMDVNITVG